MRLESRSEEPSVVEALEGPEASASEASASVVAAGIWLSATPRWEPGRARLELARDSELART
jgi:hypothetical protein